MTSPSADHLDTRTYLGVEHDRHMLSAPGGERLSQALQSGSVALVVSVAEVKPGHVHAGIYELPQSLHIPASRPKGADDLYPTTTLIALGEDVVLADSTRTNREFHGIGLNSSNGNGDIYTKRQEERGSLEPIVSRSPASHNMMF